MSDPQPERAAPDAAPPIWKRPRTWLNGGIVAALSAAAAYHQTWFAGWYIEDAAISFAYARNWAMGEGLVPTPGLERTEGYSNFTWVALLAAAELLGFDSFQASKAMQYALAALTVPFVFLLAREAAPAERSHVPLVAAGYLASAATFAIWGACGLENALFNFLIAVALWRSAVEVRTGGFPFAALAWCLVAMSRPEAILYAAVAGALSMAFTAGPFGARPTLMWLLAFFVPFGLYHAIRFSYFAFEFPQTYYGKMTTKEPDPFAWQRRGWKYVRNWSHELWTAYFLPIWFFGLLGSRGWRGVVALAALAGTAFWLIYPSNEAITASWWPASLPAPAWWVDARSYVLIADALLLPVLALGGGRGWQARILCWGTANAVMFFAIYTHGDWMKAWRWMNLLQVPAAVLFGLGAGAFADLLDAGITWIERRIRPGLVGPLVWSVAQVAVLAAWWAWGPSFAPGRWVALAVGEGAVLAALLGALATARAKEPWGFGGWTVAGLLLGAALLPNLSHTVAQSGRPETGPFAIKPRVDFVLDLARKLDIDGPIVDLDVDMGAHLWWGGERFHMVDIAGLVDIPMAQHRFERPFVREYLFQEMRPHYAHVHGGWATNSRIPSHPEWRTDYVEIPGYPAGKTNLHIGNHVRRDLIFQPAWPHGSERRVALEDGVVLEGFRIPSEPARARTMWLQVGLRDVTRRTDGQDLVLLAFAANEDHLQTWEIPLAHGWLPASAWRPDEVFVGGVEIALPKELPEGRYDVGFVVMAPGGRVLAPLPDGLGPEATAPARDRARVAVGEVVYPGALEIVSLDQLSQLAKADREEGLEHARRGRCEAAETSWFLSRKHRPADQKYLSEHGPNVRLQLATCWAWRAEQEPERAVEHLERARLLDRRAPGYLANKDAVADRLYADGLAARERGDAEAAYAAFRDTLRVDPTRSWARRYAEQARAERLSLGDEPLPQAAREKRPSVKGKLEPMQAPIEVRPAGPDADGDG